jgi:hypothetical protein
MADLNILGTLKQRFEANLNDTEYNEPIAEEVNGINDEHLQAELTQYSIKDIPTTTYTSLKDVNAYNEKFRFAIEYRKDMIKDRLEQIEENLTRLNLDDNDYYPTVYSTGTFNENIYNKKEFNIFKSEIKDKANKPDSKQFKLSKPQAFVKSFISPETPYNGILLFHEVGVGKTCAALSIAENFRTRFNREYKHKIIIMTPSETLHAGWKNEIYNTDPDKTPAQMCLPHKKLPEKQAKKHIKKFYELTTYGKFNGKINKVYNEFRCDYKGQNTEKGRREKQKTCKRNNCVWLSIDNDERRITWGGLTGDNYKFGFYNGEDTAPADTKNIFCIENNQVSIDDIDGIEDIGDFTHISILDSDDNIMAIISTREENICVPKEGHNPDERLIQYINDTYSNRIIIMDEIHNTRNIDEDKGGNSKDNKEKKGVRKYIKLIARYATNTRFVLLSATPMFDNPKEIIWILDILLLNDKRAKLNEDDIFEGNELTADGLDIIKKYSTGYVSFVRGEDPFSYPHKLYPNDGNVYIPGRDIVEFKDNKDKDDNVVPEENKIFGNIPDASITNFGYKFYKNELEDIQKRGLLSASDAPEELKRSFIFLPEGTNKSDAYKYENLAQYSKKFHTILEKIKNSEGIVFVYADRLVGALEEFKNVLKRNGYKHLEQTNTIGLDNNNFVYLTGKIPKKTLSKFVDKINDSGNKYGKNIKVILASRTLSEGVSLFNIREMHILQPWWNFSRIDQVIGRGVRRQSHIHLPKEEQNITIYLHCLSDLDGKETYDEYTYRRAYDKLKTVSRITKALKENAIDYHLMNKLNRVIEDDASEYSRAGLQITGISQKDSQKNDRTGISIIDQNYSKGCDFAECRPYITGQLNINETTYNFLKNKTLLDKIEEKMSNLFTGNPITIDDIKRELDIGEDNVDSIYWILNKLVKNIDDEGEFTNGNNIYGSIIYNKGKYIFQPTIIKDREVSIYDRDHAHEMYPIDKLLITKKDLKQMKKDLKPKQKAEGEDIPSIELPKTSVFKHLNKITNPKITEEQFQSIRVEMAFDRFSYNDKIPYLKHICLRHNELKHARPGSSNEKIIYDYLIENDYNRASKSWCIINREQLNLKIHESIRRMPEFQIGFRLLDYTFKPLNGKTIDDKKVKYKYFIYNNSEDKWLEQQIRLTINSLDDYININEIRPENTRLVGSILKVGSRHLLPSTIKPSFKVLYLDKDWTPKRTKAGPISRKSLKKGGVCKEIMTKFNDRVRDYNTVENITQYVKNGNIHIKGAESLCILLEIILRHHRKQYFNTDIDTPGPRDTFFYFENETVAMKLKYQKKDNSYSNIWIGRQ